MNQEIKFPVDLKLYKSLDMIYFSQLDLVKILERALRRSKLPVYYTKGFNPRIKISFKNALKVGVEGEIELTLYFTQPLEHLYIREQLQRQLPKGLEILPK